MIRKLPDRDRSEPPFGRQTDTRERPAAGRTHAAHGEADRPRLPGAAMAAHRVRLCPSGRGLGLYGDGAIHPEGTAGQRFQRQRSAGGRLADPRHRRNVLGRSPLQPALLHCACDRRGLPRQGQRGLRGGYHDGLCRASLDRGHPGQHVRPPDAGRSRVLPQHADRAADLRLHQRRRQDAEPVLEHDYRHRPRHRHGDRAGRRHVLD